MRKPDSRLFRKGRKAMMAVIMTLLPFVVLSQSIPKMKYEDKVRIKEGYHLLETVGEKIWKGWSEASIPINFVDDEYEYLIDHPHPEEDYVLVEKETFLRKTIYGRTRKTQQYISASYHLSGVPTAVIGTPKNLHKSSSSWVLALLHEMFHVFQTNRNDLEKIKRLKLERGPDASWMLNFPFPYADDTIRGLIHQLNYSLSRCLKAESKENLEFEIIGYLEIRKAFKELLKLKSGNEHDYNYCRFQEWKEGGARYTERKILELAGTTDYKSIPEFQKLPDYDDFKEIWKRVAPGRGEQYKNIASKNLKRLDFYALGAGQAEVLDRLDEEWKEDYFKLDVWLDDIFEASFQKAISLIGKPAPGFTLKDFSGKEHQLKDYLEQPVFLFFLSVAEWASPVHRMLPTIEAIQQEFKDKGLIILGIILMSKESEIKEFLGQHKLNFTLLSGMGENPYVPAKELKPYRAEAVPIIVLIQKDGTVSFTHTGELKKEDLYAQVRKLFNH